MKKLRVLNLDWFNYLPFKVETPIVKGKGKLFEVFMSQMAQINSRSISVDQFPELISEGKYKKYKITSDSLCRAAYKGDLRMIIHFSNTRPELMSTLNQKGLDPFNVALKYAKIKSFSVLLSQSQQFQEYSHNFGSVLILAIQSGNPKVVDLMLNRKIDVNAVDKYGNTALHYVFENLKEPNIDNFHKMTEKLLAKKINLNHLNKDGETPLVYALKKDVQYPFLMAEAWNDLQRAGVQESSFRKSNQTPKFDFDIPDSKNGKTCLHYAACTSFLGLVYLIIFQAPRSNFTVDDSLRLPYQYKESKYLVSRKMLVGGYRKSLRRH